MCFGLSTDIINVFWDSLSLKDLLQTKMKVLSSFRFLFRYTAFQKFGVGRLFEVLKKRLFCSQKNTVNNCFLCEYLLIYFCDQSWIFSIITPVFSVTWFFRNHSNMLILLKKHFWLLSMLKKVVLLFIFVENDSTMNRKFKRTAFVWKVVRWYLSQMLCHFKPSSIKGCSAFIYYILFRKY